MMLRPGDRILAGADVYGGTYRLLHKIVNRSGLRVTLVPTHNLHQLERAFCKQTRLLWLESPGNPLMSISDISACAEIAHRHGALLAVDNTLATPVLTKPLELGADLVMHSATKYLGGHSDLIGGALVVRERQLYDELYFIQNATGAVLAPFDCYMLARGLKTLELRVREHSRSALQLARRLLTDRRIRRVLYPGLESHAGHDLACRQMDRGFGGMLSFEVQGSCEQTQRFVAATRLFQLAVSLGAVESLIEQPAAMSHASYDPVDRQAHGIIDGLVRLSVGLEDPDDLWDDLQQALATGLG
jgi:cystathionine gamma-lyase